MRKIKLFQIDAFTEKTFGGNPAAVCVFDKWPSDQLMQNIAAENNLAETAFLVKNSEGYEIRWFTPTVEVDLCGHATLAGAYVVFNFLNYSETTIQFQSKNSGILKVSRDNDFLILDFPADNISKTVAPEGLAEALGSINIKELYKGKTDFLVVLNDENQVAAINPNFYLLNQIQARGIIVTASGINYDFVSRFFGPRVGVPEDPVTGSAHTTLIPYWSRQLNKTKLTAKQISSRGGELTCEIREDRVFIGGKATLYLQGDIYLPE